MKRLKSITSSLIRRQVKIELLTNRELYTKKDGTVDQFKLSENIRTILGLYGEGWDHRKYYMVELVVYSVCEELNILIK